MWRASGASWHQNHLITDSHRDVQYGRGYPVGLTVVELGTELEQPLVSG